MDNAEFRAIQVDYDGKKIENNGEKANFDVTPKALKKIIEKGNVPTIEIKVVNERGIEETQQGRGE